MRNKFTSHTYWSFVFALLSLVCCFDTHATPPSEIKMEYDQESKVLFVDIAHISDKADEHYISKITLEVNGLSSETFYYRRQVQPSGFEVDFPLELKPEDVVTLKAQCAQGGALEASLTIEANEENSSAVSVKPAVKTPTSNPTKSSNSY